MSHRLSRRLLLPFLIVTLCAGSFFAGVAWTYDAKLDLAQDNIVKAIALLEAADVPDQKGQRCRKLTEKGVKLLQKTLDKTELAKTCSDQ
jgi:hypothetical protein